MATNDPVGFAQAINWDAVDQNLDTLAEVLLSAPCGYCTQSAVLNEDGLCPACKNREDREAFVLEQDALEHARLYGDVQDALTGGLT